MIYKSIYFWFWFCVCYVSNRNRNRNRNIVQYNNKIRYKNKILNEGHQMNAMKINLFYWFVFDFQYQ